MSDVTEPERGPLTLAQIHWLQGWVSGVVDHDPFAGRMLERALDELENSRRYEGPTPTPLDFEDARIPVVWATRPHDAPGWADRWEKDDRGVCCWRGEAPSLGHSNPRQSNPRAPAYAYAKDVWPQLPGPIVVRLEVAD